MALGAQPGQVRWMILREGLAIAGAGAGIGPIGGFAVTRLVASRLYGVRPADPLSFAAATLVLAVAAFLGCWVPARRATEVDPLAALRYE